MFRKTMAVGPLEEVASWVTGYTGDASHRTCCGEGFPIPPVRRGRIIAAGSRKAIAEMRRCLESREEAQP
jgi:hypothetical protein